jgi:hypothetical protein
VIACHNQQIHEIFQNFSFFSSVEQSSGVDVMVTVFSDFCQFSAKKIGVSLRNQCYDQFISKTGCSLSKKRQLFLTNVLAKISLKS